MGPFFYHGIWRMDWGLGNPNKTAALIAMLMVAVWYLAGVRKYGFWLSLVVFTALGVGLVHTFSRGGIIALFFGLAPLLYFAPRPWPRNNVIGAIISIWIIMGASIYLDASQRYEQGVIKEDRSITNRLEIWKAAPQMMVDAPAGWGLGKSGDAFIQWYQPLDHSESYRTLVNSHLTWLVEVGWPLRFLYVFAWAAILVVCWPSSEHPLLSIALGTWIALAVAATFSSVAESVWLWILPGMCLTAALVERARTKVWPKPIFWLVPVCTSAVLIATLAAVGSGSHFVRTIGGSIILGKGEPTCWVIIDNNVMGPRYGHTLRQYLTTSSAKDVAIAIVPPEATLPEPTGKIVVFAGQHFDLAYVKKAMASAKQVVLLNPTISPQELNIPKEFASRATIAFGEFSESPAVNSWDGYGSVRRLPGVGDYIPRWPDVVRQLQ